jgi:uncharacterized RDD family membrane protein YckC
MIADLGIVAVLDLALGGGAQLVAVLLPKWIWLTTAIPAAVGVVIAVLPFAYFFITVAVTGRTVGKALMGIQIVAKDGRSLPVLRSLLRTVAYVISLVPLFGGFLWILIDNDRRGWHDHIAGSRVVFADSGHPSDHA